MNSDKKQFDDNVKFCTKCGQKCKQSHNFCTKCGEKLNKKHTQIEQYDIAKESLSNINNEAAAKKSNMQIGNTNNNTQNNNPLAVFIKVIRNKIWIVVFIALLAIGTSVINYNCQDKPQNTEVYQLETPDQVLNKIDELQAKYFEIIKRHDVLLYGEVTDEKEKDAEELYSLYKEVENNIDKDNYYLKKYNKIVEKYATNPYITTQDMNEFEIENYKAIDKLLNETYQAVRAKIPNEDFKKLITSELNWLKEVDNYYKIYEKQDYGSIRVIARTGYEIDMRSFRTLLLMLYLNN